MKARTKVTMLLAGAVAALALGSLGWAAIPDAAGTIHGCYDRNSGQLRVTDTETSQPKACTTKESPLTWNQKGLQGPQGPPGESNVLFKAPTGVKALGIETILAAFQVGSLGSYEVEAKLEVGSQTSPAVATCWLVGNPGEVVLDTARTTLYAPVGDASTTLHLLGASQTGLGNFQLRCTLPNGYARDVKFTVTPVDNLGIW